MVVDIFIIRSIRFLCTAKKKRTYYYRLSIPAASPPKENRNSRRKKTTKKLNSPILSVTKTKSYSLHAPFFVPNPESSV